MEVVVTEKLNLSIVNLPFEFYFSSGNKNRADSDYNHWFTPSGKCRIYFGGCHIQEVGRYNLADYDKLVKAMKKYKCDILTDGACYYTVAGDRIGKILNMSSIIYQANAEWQALSFDDKKEYVEGTKLIEL